MKRDLDLCRTIMLVLEESQTSSTLESLSRSMGSERGQVFYQVRRLNEAGLITSDPPMTSGSIPVSTTFELSWDGHEFLDAARESKVWNWAKEQAGKVPGFTFSLMLPMIKAYAKSEMHKLGIPIE